MMLYLLVLLELVGVCGKRHTNVDDIHLKRIGKDSLWRRMEDREMSWHWHADDLPYGDAVWTRKERMAVRRALASELEIAKAATKTKNLPKIFVYPFPTEFTDPKWISANLANRNITRIDRPKYWDVLGFQRLESKHESWDIYESAPRGIIDTGSKKGNKTTTKSKVTLNDWTPSQSAMGQYRNSVKFQHHRKNAKKRIDCFDRSADPQLLEDNCVLRTPQHSLGMVVHRSLKKAYSALVDDPAEADLFFIPEYSSRGDTQWCSTVGAVWKKHLDLNFPGYLERNSGNDHFVVVGRTFHRTADVPSTYALYTSRKPSFLRGFECQYRTDWHVRRIRLEVQDPYVRYCHRIYPVPYSAFLAYSTRPAFGRAWFNRKDGPLLLKNTKYKSEYRAVAVFGSDDSRKDMVRAQFLNTCKKMKPDGSCLDVTAVANRTYYNTVGIGTIPNTITAQMYGGLDFEDAYRSALFSFQPPGISAARKGIVDSIMAGTIPILVKEDDSYRDHKGRPYIYAHDQRDLWPWHWSAQRASSLIIERKYLETPGRLETFINSIDKEQLRLMQLVLRLQAPGLAWPIETHISSTIQQFDDDDHADASSVVQRPSALDLTMRHLFYIVQYEASNPPQFDCHKPPPLESKY